jgi:splicing factor U2AF subunit
LSKFGRLEALHVCDNLGDHMIGHVYAKFAEEEEAADALNVMNGRYYDGRRMEVEFSPVTDFREARCRDFDEDTCRRGGFCNFMHIKPVPLCLIRDMEDEAEDERRREEMERMERRRREERRDHRGGGGGSDHRRGRRDRERKGGRRGGGGSRSRSRSRSHSRSGSRERGGGSGVV